MARRASTVAFAAGSLLLVAAISAAAGPMRSAYTRHDFQACAARPSPHPDVVEIRVCSGLAGIDVVWTGEPDSSALAFGKAPKGEAIPGLDVFYEPRETIEWRGLQGAGGLVPAVAIVRYDTGRAIGRLGASRLVAYRVAADRPSCVMGVVFGSSTDANARARALVDHYAAGFVCGRSTVIRDR